MKIEKYKFPHSSFLSVEKDTEIIVSQFLKNNNLKKLLYYTTPDCLSKPVVSTNDAVEMMGKQIQITPYLPIDGSVKAYVYIDFDTFIPNATNPEFRDNVVEFDIICHLDQWQLDDMKLRPYRIAAEIDSMISDQKLTGIGTLQFQGAARVNINAEFHGICLRYIAIHGGEEKVGMPNPADEQAMKENFDTIFNIKDEL